MVVETMTESRLETSSGLLAARPPFDFAKTLAFMRHFSPMADEQTIAGGTLTKAMALGGRAVVFAVRGSRSVEQPALRFTLYAERALEPAEHAAALDRVRWFLSLDDDLEPFYAIAREDAEFWPIVERFYGLHQPKFLAPFEIACWAVLTQRTPMPVARRLKDRLIERYGHAMTLDGVTYRAFPEPAMLAEVTRFFGKTDERWLRTGPYDEVAARLRAVRGIGEWSATFILVRGLGRMERVAAVEGALAQAAARLYNGGKPLADDELRRKLDRYGAYQGYWAFYTRIAVNGGDHRAME